MRAGPFTDDWMLEALQAHAPRLHVPQKRERAQVVTLLSMIDSAYHNRAGQMLAIDARYAIWILGHFFEKRGQACQEGGVDPQVVENELRMRAKFDGFVEAMNAHPRMLDMDAASGMLPYKSWRDFDHWIAYAFKLALEPCNREKLGFTTEGPIARLTNAAIEVITDKAPGVRNVGQHLKQPYQKRGRTR